MTDSSDLPDEFQHKEVVPRSRKCALNRETLRATGTGKFRGIFPSLGEFATIPSPPLPDNFRLILRRLSMRFLRKGGIYRSDVVSNQNQSQNQNLGRRPTASRWSAPVTQAKERVGRPTPFSSSAMSSAPAIP